MLTILYAYIDKVLKSANYLFVFYYTSLNSEVKTQHKTSITLKMRVSR